MGSACQFGGSFVLPPALLILAPQTSGAAWQWIRLATQVCALLIAIPLQIRIIAALLRGRYRRFPILFAYMIVAFLTTVVEAPTAVTYLRNFTPHTLSNLYWPLEDLSQVLVYSVVMSLIYQATAKLRARRIVRASLIAGAVLFAVISYLIHHEPGANPGSWMTPWTADLNFCAMILDLALWALLITSRERDHRVLLLSGGLGIDMAGGAIGESVRNLAQPTRSHPLSFTGSLIGMLANLVFLYIWWRALRHVKYQEGPTGRRGDGR